jgi:DNA-binding SARP family transcriptional activator
LLLDAAPELLPEDAYEAWLQPHAAAFREWRAQVVLDIAGKQAAAGEPQKAVVLLTPIVAADPLNEPALRALMHALDASGRRSEALVAYERLRAELMAQLGSDPEPQTRSLFRAMLGDPSGTPSGRRARDIPGQRPPGNLPAAVSSLVGRAHELDEV